MDLLPKTARRTAARLEFAGERSCCGAGERRMADLRGDRMAMIFQEPMTSLNPAYTIGNQLEEALLRHRKVSRARGPRPRRLPAGEGRHHRRRRAGSRQYPHQLSGGLRQRVMIAMALMCGPDLIIADEPTTALDVTIQAQILLLLSRAAEASSSMALILITHDLGVVARVADRVAVMYAGQDRRRRAPCRGGVRAPDCILTPVVCSECIPIAGEDASPAAHLGSIPGIVPSLILVGSLHGCMLPRSLRTRHRQRRDAVANPRSSRSGISDERRMPTRCILESLGDAQPTKPCVARGRVDP